MTMTESTGETTKTIPSPSSSKKEKAPTKTKRELQFEKDTKMVKGIFRCQEVPGGTLNFHFRKYKEVPLKHYSFLDGQIYEVPYMVATHITNNCWYPVHRYMQNEDGSVHTKIGQKVSRCRFEPLGFVDIEDFSEPSEIVTVERV